MAHSPHRRMATGEGSTPLRVGDQAPVFELRRTFDESVSLDELVSRGPVLIAFYVFDFGNI